ncbi:MAG: hypothetical protein CSA68_04915 [Rhodobacterales bacterium]|nr:MAG: hypothetical protein CSA68_04915 [Rhodobacterales bacterium]
MLPDDQTLSEQGFDPDAGQGRILLLACGALAREILHLIKVNGWSHMQLTCLPANLHLYPDRIPEAVEQAVLKYRDQFDSIFVVYADCGTGGQLLQKCKELGVDMVEGPHCYSFFETNEAFAKLSQDECTAFYLTDFLVRQFDAFVWKPMGLDKHPDLLHLYFGNYEKLIYQAQTNQPELDAKAAAIAQRMGLRYERRFTGYGDLETTLQQVSQTR